MAKWILLYLSCELIVCTCLADRSGALNIKVRRLARKTDSLQKDVDDIWEIILSSGTNVQEFGNSTWINDVQSIRKDFEARVENVVASISKMKSEVNQFLSISRKGIKNEKQWLREVVRNITEMFNDFQTSFTNGLDKNVLNKIETINTELYEGAIETKKELEYINMNLDDLRANYNEIENENQALKQSILEIQKHYTAMKTENRALRQTNIRIQNDQENLVQTISNIQNGYENMKNENTVLSRGIYEIRADNKKMKSEMTKLRAKLSVKKSKEQLRLHRQQQQTNNYVINNTNNDEHNNINNVIDYVINNVIDYVINYVIDYVINYVIDYVINNKHNTNNNVILTLL